MEKIKRNPWIHGFKCSKERWDEIFGKKEASAKTGAYVLHNDKLVHIDDLPQEVRPTDSKLNLPAIHTDAIYTKKFDWGAGRKWNSGTERREWMKANQKECKG